VKNYSKLWIAGIGLLALVLGPDVMGIVQDEAKLYQGLLAIVTAYGIYQVPNTPA